MSLFTEESSLINRPVRVNVQSKIQELSDSVEQLQLYTEFSNIEDNYDNVSKFEDVYGVTNLTITATNLLDTQILEELMKLCYKHKSPQKVLQILEMHNKDFNLFD